MNTKKNIEYAAYVKNRIDNSYDLLFTTTCSLLLAQDRAIEKAEEFNKYSGFDYDTNDMIYAQREIITTYGNWEPIKNTEV